MGPLGALISSLVLSDVGTIVARTKRNAIFMTFAGLLFFTAYIFLLVAAAIALGHRYGALTATLVIAGASIGIAIVILMVMAGITAGEKRRAAERRRKSQAQTNIAVATALTLFRKNPLVAAGIAVGVGALLGVTRGSRRDD